MRAALLMLAPLAASSCLGLSASPDAGPSPSGAPCRTDSDCPVGLQCSRFSTCIASLADITVTWTIQGAPAGTSSCTGVDHLDVAYLAAGATLGGFSPVACAPGKLHFDRLPGDIDSVSVVERDAQGRSLGSASAPIAGPPSGETAAVALPAP